MLFADGSNQCTWTPASASINTRTWRTWNTRSRCVLPPFRKSGVGSQMAMRPDLVSAAYCWSILLWHDPRSRQNLARHPIPPRLRYKQDVPTHYFRRPRPGVGMGSGRHACRVLRLPTSCSKLGSKHTANMQGSECRVGGGGCPEHGDGSHGDGLACAAHMEFKVAACPEDGIIMALLPWIFVSAPQLTLRLPYITHVLENSYNPHLVSLSSASSA